MKRRTFAEGETTAFTYDGKPSPPWSCDTLAERHEKKKNSRRSGSKNKHVILIIKTSLSDPGASPEAD